MKVFSSLHANKVQQIMIKKDRATRVDVHRRKMLVIQFHI